jgi:signal transduction histidine kinase/streptogramin lyase
LHLYQGRVDRFTRADGLSGDTVFDLLEDREGNIWAVTEHGVDRFRDLPVTTLSKREGLSEDTAGSVIASKDGGVWIGTGKGLNRVQDNGKISVYGKSNGLPSESIGSLFEDRDGTLWVSSALGLAYGGAGGFHIVTGPGNPHIGSVGAATLDRDGDLWLSDMEAGLIRIHRRQIVSIRPWPEFEHKQALALSADPGSSGLWIGFAQGGLAYYRPGEPVRWYRDAGAGAATDLRVDREGQVWIATLGGLSLLRNGRIVTMSAKNGLPCEQIQAMVEDDDGALWLNTACGLVYLTRQDLASWVANPEIKIHPKSFGPGDGMQARSTLSGSSRRAAKSSDGRLWFPVFDGVAIVDPRHLPHNRVPPPTEIGRITVDGREYLPQADLRFPPRPKDLQIEYTAFSFVDPDRVRFRYKLEGYDEHWNEVAGRRQAFYSNLRPRAYRFRVAASNNDGVWNDAGAALDFSIQPAFYQTMWFIIVTGTSFALFLWLVYRARLHQVKAKMQLLFEERLRERTRISRELHDTLLQEISALALQLDGLSKVVTEPKSAKGRLREMREEAERWLRQTRESVSDLRTNTPEEQELFDAVRQLGEQMTRGTAIEFRATCAGTPSGISPLVQQQLLKILQEAFRNAVRHSQATEITADLSYLEKDKLRLLIRDNGRGFDLSADTPGHWGLITMQERAQAIRAELKMSASAGAGAAIEINAPIAS